MAGVLARVVTVGVLLALVAWPERHGVIIVRVGSAFLAAESYGGGLEVYAVGLSSHLRPPWTPPRTPLVFFARAVEGLSEDAARASRRRMYCVRWTRVQVIERWRALKPHVVREQLADLRFRDSEDGTVDDWYYRDAGFKALLNGVDLDDLREWQSR